MNTSASAAKCVSWSSGIVSSALLTRSISTVPRQPPENGAVNSARAQDTTIFGNGVESLSASLSFPCGPREKIGTIDAPVIHSKFCAAISRQMFFEMN